jgi:hypothetical protein
MRGHVSANISTADRTTVAQERQRGRGGQSHRHRQQLRAAVVRATLPRATTALTSGTVL